MEGSGVDSLKEVIYLVSAISRLSRISSRSSMSSARCVVSLGRGLCQSSNGLSEIYTYPMENRF